MTEESVWIAELVTAWALFSQEKHVYLRAGKGSIIQGLWLYSTSVRKEIPKLCKHFAIINNNGAKPPLRQLRDLVGSMTVFCSS